jgi:hypothetical protein
MNSLQVNAHNWQTIGVSVRKSMVLLRMVSQAVLTGGNIADPQ